MNTLTADLLDFLNSSPCNFWAVDNLRRKLEDAGFEPLDMRQSWTLRPGGRYFVEKERFGNLRVHSRNRPCRRLPDSMRAQRFARFPPEARLRNADGRRDAETEHGSLRRSDSVHMVRPSALHCRTCDSPRRQCPVATHAPGQNRPVSAHHSPILPYTTTAASTTGTRSQNSATCSR